MHDAIHSIYLVCIQVNLRHRCKIQYIYYNICMHLYDSSIYNVYTIYTTVRVYIVVVVSSC